MSTPVSDILRQLSDLDPSSDRYQLLLSDLLSHQGLKRHVRGLQGTNLQAFVELLDNVSTRPVSKSTGTDLI